MNKLQVIVDRNIDSHVPDGTIYYDMSDYHLYEDSDLPELIQSVKSACESALESTRDAGCDDLYLGSVDTDTMDSNYFQLVGAVWDVLVTHTRSDEVPSSITIAASTNEIADYYMMVYNFWHADEKAVRIMSDNWD